MTMPGGYVPKPSPWTDENVELLKKLCQHGMSASEIADRLPFDVTRNAVIGKLARLNGYTRPDRTASELGDRLAYNGRRGFKAPAAPGRLNGKGLYGHERPAQSPADVILVQVRPARGLAAEKVLVFDKARPKPNGHGKTLIDLEARDCRYPVSGAGEDAIFCAAQRVEGSSYCPRHTKLCCGVAAASEKDLARNLRRYL